VVGHRRTILRASLPPAFDAEHTQPHRCLFPRDPISYCGTGIGGSRRARLMRRAIVAALASAGTDIE
jgi:hypothetical protein